MILCCLIPAMLAAQKAIEGGIAHRLGKTTLYISYLNKLQQDVHDFHSGQLSSESQITRLANNLEHFRKDRTTDYMAEQAESMSAFGKSIENKAFSEIDFDKSLSELAHKIKMGDEAGEAIQALLDKLNTITTYLESSGSSLRLYSKLSLVILYFSIVIILIALIRLFRHTVTSRIPTYGNYAEALGHGNPNDKALTAEGDDAIGKLSHNLNLINSTIRKATGYVRDLSNGTHEYEPEAQDKDNGLLCLIDGLARQMMLRKEEDEQRNWINVGIAKFVEILRDQNIDIKDFGDRIISELVKYTGANQGVIFYLQSSGGDRYLDPLSTYAWGKKRFVEDRITLDSANLMTEAIKGGESIYIKEVPADFIKITSGLGYATPNAVLIVPLIANEEPLGVIELATFKEFEKHKIEFINKICESVSATFASITISDRTKKLLESSQAMTEQLRAQEEELRQNAEELESSRENLHRELELAKLEMQQQVEVIEGEKLKNIAILEGCVDGVVIFKEDGIVDFFNRSAEEIWNIPREEIKGKSIKKLFPVEICEENGEYHIYYKGEGQFKRIDVRTEISCFGPSGDELTLLVTASSGEVKGSQTFAFFVQTLTVELF